ncbi:hypothetical protein PISMIDRAFT_681406 [Pisolithus microcarpus 441]|uniref:Uncharacterized protein n=1 Tax=Pisolithus microcarpus 441 TaxID=765257 RepID=A0A0C9YXC1_9AGAM|nr:hypothetical protein PISMIDRAFT_681406 [Pisolithus microcarpus 441]
MTFLARLLHNLFSRNEKTSRLKQILSSLGMSLHIESLSFRRSYMQRCFAIDKFGAHRKLV